MLSDEPYQISRLMPTFPRSLQDLLHSARGSFTALQ